MSDTHRNTPTERRRHTRHEMSQQARVFYEPGRELVVDMIDLSFEGLCIEGDGDAVIEMLPVTDDASGYDKVPLRVCFDTVAPAQSCNIQLLVSTVYLKPVADGRTQLGVEIIDVEDGVLELSDYIAGLEG